MKTKEIVMLKPAENLDFKFLKVKNHTSSRPSHFQAVDFNGFFYYQKLGFHVVFLK